jgi:flagellar biosynthetic protein FlhB
MTGYFEIDLQLFSEERKESATPRRRQMAREKGQIFFSQDLASSVSIFFAVLTLKYSLKFSTAFLARKSAEIWMSSAPPNPGMEWASKAVKDVAITFMLATLPVMAASTVFGITASVLQVGFSAKPALLLPDFKRLNPLEGFKRIFSRRSLQALCRSLAKIFLVGLLTWNTVKSIWPQLSFLMVTDLARSVSVIIGSIEKVLINSSILLMGIGVLDYGYQWWEYEKSLMMTGQEVKEEMKDTEGKPEVRQAIRQRQRRVAMGRMMQDVPSADVVLVNPTHYAVALKYNIDEDVAPKVVAKGLNELALRIRALAEENSVCIMEDPPLTQALYRAVEVGDVVPEELYQAVAQVLAYVYRVSGKVAVEGT